MIACHFWNSWIWILPILFASISFLTKRAHYANFITGKRVHWCKTNVLEKMITMGSGISYGEYAKQIMSIVGNCLSALKNSLCLTSDSVQCRIRSWFEGAIFVQQEVKFAMNVIGMAGTADFFLFFSQSWILLQG